MFAPPAGARTQRIAFCGDVGTDLPPKTSQTRALRRSQRNANYSAVRRAPVRVALFGFHARGDRFDHCRRHLELLFAIFDCMAEGDPIEVGVGGPTLALVFLE